MRTKNVVLLIWISWLLSRGTHFSLVTYDWCVASYMFEFFVAQGGIAVVRYFRWGAVSWLRLTLRTSRRWVTSFGDRWTWCRSGCRLNGQTTGNQKNDKGQHFSSRDRGVLTLVFQNVDQTVRTVKSQFAKIKWYSKTNGRIFSRLNIILIVWFVS